ncbi:hypothetical protein [Agromyces laixinhei]|uniref:hypothetical protein n=1 Tax=Agromyces laixinhei TaxID=2585717 RepID=UPI0011178E69|nr:hypothetical protein [Agromyces laixinhei]
MSYPLYPADPNRDPAEPFRGLDSAPTTGSQTTVEIRPDIWDDGASPRPVTVEEVFERQQEQFGGVKIGSAFFGWLTATGLAAILTGLLTAAGVAFGLVGVQDRNATAGNALLEAEAVGWISAGVLFVTVLVAYYAGGYVAGRMARFSGVAQGVAVWVWALAIAIIVAVAGFVLGTQVDLLGRLDAFARIPVSEGTLTIVGVISAAAVAVTSLGGAILGGVVGARYHRRVDRAGLE